MKKFQLLFPLVLFITMISQAQKTFNKLVTKKAGTFTSFPSDNTIKTLSGGYAFAESEANNAYLAILDKNFNFLWARDINIDPAFKSSGLSVAQSTTDSSYCMVGVTSDPSRPEYDLLISRVDKNGDLLNTKTYSVAGNNAGPAKIVAMPRGKFLIASGNGSQVSLVGLNAKGVPYLTRMVYYYGGLSLGDMIATDDDGFMLTGFVMYDPYPAPRDIFCLKLDRFLNIQWNKTYKTGKLETATGIIQTKDGGYFIYGFYQQNNPDNQNRYIKIASDGSLQWNKIVRYQNNGLSASVVQASDGGYALSGSNFVKLNRRGDVQWISSQAVNGIVSPVLKQHDGGFVTFTQWDASHLNIIKLDSAGNTCNPLYTPTYTLSFDSVIVSPASFSMMIDSAVLINKGRYFIQAGTASSFLCQQALAEVGTKSAAEITKHFTGNSTAALYPNPAKDKAVLTINMINGGNAQIIISGADGKILKTVNVIIHKGENIFIIDVSVLAKGIYFLKLSSSKEHTNLKFIKE